MVDNNITFVGILFITLILWLIKECFTIHMGIICAYSNAAYICALAIVLPCFIMMSHYYDILNAKTLVGGALLFTIVMCAIKITTKVLDNKEYKEYKEEHRIIVENINEDNLITLLKYCNDNNIDITNYRCSCKCQFGDMRECDEVVIDDDCIAMFGCGNVQCKVFNTKVDYVTCNPLSIQDDMNEDDSHKKCLLSKIEVNEELKKLIEGVKDRI